MLQRVAPRRPVRQDMAVRHSVLSLKSTAAILLIGFACALPAAAEERADGTTDLPVPRFVSLKSNSAMMRTGPDDRRFPIAWEYKRRGLPLEIVREYGIWRQVRDPEGTIGWMNKSLLTGERTGFITPAADSGPRTLYTAPDLQSRVAWRIEPGAVVTITLCENVWCRVSNGGRSGYILRNHLWGTYPNEAING
ncbi:hypothetical protein GCM10011529_25900 [Polymorphobacter glacialis]|uniref:SH3b domain-containing protein n=1 Tax=Sandarakinorhabdus glacialis TaxID=1614636 RepID=A0A916ZXP1_9SPHN|nr:hypothetical protein GCM10011529_25900 [Polymorphobacter glacialis]